RQHLPVEGLCIRAAVLKDVILRQSLNSARVLCAQGTVTRPGQCHETQKQRQLLGVFAGAVQFTDLPIEKQQAIGAPCVEIAGPRQPDRQQANASEPHTAPGLHAHTALPLVGEPTCERLYGRDMTTPRRRAGPEGVPARKGPQGIPRRAFDAVSPATSSDASATGLVANGAA